MDDLAKGIKAFLKGTPALDQYHQILNEYTKNPANSKIFFAKLFQLLNGNPILQQKLIVLAQKPPNMALFSPLDNFRIIFIQHKSCGINNPVFDQYIHILTLLIIQELIPYEFLLDFISRFRPALPQEYIKKMKDLLKDINRVVHISHCELFDRGIATMATSSTPSKIISRPTYKATDPVKIIIMARYMLTKDEQLQSFIQCLILYGLRVITNETAQKWLQKLDAYLAQFIHNSLEISTFPQKIYPSRIYSHIQQNFTDSQQQWIFGSKMINLLKNVRPLNDEHSTIPSILISCKNQKVIDKSAPNVNDLKCVKYHQAIRVIIRYFRNENADVKDLEPIIPVLKAIYGRNAPAIEVIAYCPQFLMQFVQRMRVMGMNAHNFAAKQFHTKLSQISVRDIEWRVIYQKILKSNFVLHGIVFSKIFRVKILGQKALQSTITFFGSFLQRFDKNIREIFEIFIGFYQKEQVYSSHHVVLALLFFQEVGSVLEEANLEESQILKLPDEIFSSSVPIVEYCGIRLANVDIPAVRFVQHLSKLVTTDKNPVFYSRFEEAISQLTDEFVFGLTNNADVIAISTIINGGRLAF